MPVSQGVMTATAMTQAVVVEKDTARSTASLPRRVLMASHNCDWKRTAVRDQDHRGHQEIDDLRGAVDDRVLRNSQVRAEDRQHAGRPPLQAGQGDAGKPIAGGGGIDIRATGMRPRRRLGGAAVLLEHAARDEHPGQRHEHAAGKEGPREDEQRILRGGEDAPRR